MFEVCSNLIVLLCILEIYCISRKKLFIYRLKFICLNFLTIFNFKNLDDRDTICNRIGNRSINLTSAEISNSLF